MRGRHRSPWEVVLTARPVQGKGNAFSFSSEFVRALASRPWISMSTRWKDPAVSPLHRAGRYGLRSGCPSSSLLTLALRHVCQPLHCSPGFSCNPLALSAVLPEAWRPETGTACKYNELAFLEENRSQPVSHGHRTDVGLVEQKGGLAWEHPISSGIETTCFPASQKLCTGCSRLGWFWAVGSYGKPLIYREPPKVCLSLIRQQLL